MTQPTIIYSDIPIRISGHGRTNYALVFTDGIPELRPIAVPGIYAPDGTYRNNPANVCRIVKNKKGEVYYLDLTAVNQGGTLRRLSGDEIPEGYSLLEGQSL